MLRSRVGRLALGPSYAPIDDNVCLLLFFVARVAQQREEALDMHSFLSLFFFIFSLLFFYRNRYTYNECIACLILATIATGATSLPSNTAGAA